MRVFSKFLVLGLLCVLSVGGSPAEARKSKHGGLANAALSSDTRDYEILKAMNNRKPVNFVEGADMEVIKLLPDDREGRKHQKWVVKLSDGRSMQAIYNLDMCEPVPLLKGDRVAMGGQFIWTNQGGILHWLHHAPKRNRPDGYVHLNGKFYCK